MKKTKILLLGDLPDLEITNYPSMIDLSEEFIESFAKDEKEAKEFIEPLAMDEKDKISVISKTVWVILKDHPERIWRLLSHWSLKDENAKNAAKKILEQGIQYGYLSLSSSYNIFWGWLFSDNKENQESASFLIKILNDIRQKKTTDYFEKSINFLPSKSNIIKDFYEQKMKNQYFKFLRYERPKNWQLKTLRKC
ncbi:MAG: hypothetical protein ACM3SY_05720 [Candidatus Omnitrophota bacterium]